MSIVKDVQEHVARLFHNHIYHLYNTYIYSWESDYFSRTKSGNDYEVEIKISRGDFFKDFKKEKHRLFNALLNKQTHIVLNGGEYMGEVYASFRSGQLTSWRHGRWSQNALEISQSATHEDFLNGYKNFRIHWQNKELRPKCTRIYIQEIQKQHAPNCFYYACPEGLIKPEELPKYAGLIYVNGHMAWVVKKSPYMHRSLVDLNAILLSKFYFETCDHRQRIRFEKSKKE